MTAQPSSVRADEIRAWYEAARWRYRAFEQAIVEHVRRMIAAAELDNLQLESRTKSVDSYVAKALLPDPVAADEFKYANPRSEITDAVGLRLVVPLSTDVAPVRAMLHEGYVIEEETDRGADEHMEVPGYQSLHLLVRLKDEDKRDPAFRDMGDVTVEVQVRTILQHAWASIQHDLTYKTERPPTPLLKRRLVALAGLLELADREFVQVRREHGAIEASTRGAALGRPAGPLTPLTTRRLVEDIVVGGPDPTDQIWYEGLHSILNELGFSDVQALLEGLGTWSDNAAVVASAVTASKPYANPTFIFDQMMRLAMGAEYFDKRLPHADLVGDEEARRVFMAERTQLLRSLEESG